MGAELLRAGGGVNVLTGGTDVHLVLCDLTQSELDGKQAEDRLAAVGITVNRNTIPRDPEKPWRTSGIRIGSPAVTTRGFREPEMEIVAELLDRTLSNLENESIYESVRRDVRALTARFPLTDGVA